MDVKNGSESKITPCSQYGITTRIVLTCNPTIEWTNQDLSDIIHVEHVVDVDPCAVSPFAPPPTIGLLILLVC